MKGVSFALRLRRLAHCVGSALILFALCCQESHSLLKWSMSGNCFHSLCTGQSHKLWICCRWLQKRTLKSSKRGANWFGDPTPGEQSKSRRSYILPSCRRRAFRSALLGPKLGWHSGKESNCQSRRWKRHSFDPWVGTIPWRRKWQPTHTPAFLPGKFHGQRMLVGYSPWGRKGLDMTEQLSS